MLDGCGCNRYLPWIWPSLVNLQFIGDIIRQHNSNKLVSIGCGSGLLEWLIHKATGIPVQGVEMDKSWWQSKYAGHTFIPMVFSSDSKSGNEVATKQDAVLLFCYFNNERAFLSYIENFRGNCFIVIGPGEGRSTHTCPEPFLLPGGLEASWRMVTSQEVGQSKDFIAVYERMLA